MNDIDNKKLVNYMMDIICKIQKNTNDDLIIKDLDNIQNGILPYIGGPAYNADLEVLQYYLTELKLN